MIAVVMTIRGTTTRLASLLRSRVRRERTRMKAGVEGTPKHDEDAVMHVIAFEFDEMVVVVVVEVVFTREMEMFKYLQLCTRIMDISTKTKTYQYQY